MQRYQISNLESLEDCIPMQGVVLENFVHLNFVNNPT